MYKYLRTGMETYCLLLPLLGCKTRYYNSALRSDEVAATQVSRRVCGLALRASKKRDALLLRVTAPSKKALEEIRGKALESRLVAFRISSEELAGVESSPRMKRDLLTCFESVKMVSNGPYEGKLSLPVNTPRRPVATGCGMVVRDDTTYLLRLPASATGTAPTTKDEFVAIPLRAIDQGSENTLSQSVGSNVCLVGDVFKFKDTILLAVDKTEIRLKNSAKVTNELALVSGDSRSYRNAYEDYKNRRGDVPLKQSRELLSSQITDLEEKIIQSEFEYLEVSNSDPEKDSKRQDLFIRIGDEKGRFDACCELLDEKLEDEASKNGFFPSLFGLRGANGDAVQTVKQGEEDQVNVDF